MLIKSLNILAFSCFSIILASPVLHAQDNTQDSAHDSAQNLNKAKKLALSSTEQGSSSDLSAALRKQLGDAVTITILDGKDCQKQQDDARMRCLAELARAQGAEWLLVRETKSADYSSLNVIDTQSQKQLGHARSDDNATQSLAIAAIKALALAGAKGDLVLDGVQIFDRLRIDGHELPLDAGRTSVTLSIGQHSVELVRVGATTLRRIVFIPYAQGLHIDSRAGLDDAQAATANNSHSQASLVTTEKTASMSQDSLSIALLGGGAGAMILGLGLGLHMALVTMPQLNWLSAQQSTGLGCTDGSKSCWDAQVESARSLTVLEGVLAVGVGLSGLAALSAGAWMLNEHSEESKQTKP